MERDQTEADQRRAPRRPILVKASIFHASNSEALDCVIREISREGARLEVSHAKELPLTFLLRIEGEAALRLCTTAWRSEDQVGVEFNQQIIERNIESQIAARNAIV
jgi:two-component system cell cycle response regulator